MSQNKVQAAAYDVFVDGAELAREHKNRIKEIRIVDYLRLPDVCTLHITFPRAQGVDTQPFEIGKTLEVRLGATKELVPHTLFKGQVSTLEPEFGSGGCSVAVRAYDRSQLLCRSRRVRTFQDQTASDIVEKILKEAGLTPKCDPSPIVHEFVQQDNETDWDFIWRLAERIGFELVVDDTVAVFRKPTPEGAVELEWPRTLRSFSPRVTAVQQVSEVTLLAHDPKTKTAIESSAQRPDQIAEIGLDRDTVAGAFDDATIHVATEPVESNAEGDTLTQALLDKLANGYIAAEGIAAGNPRIQAGAKVTVRGVGEKFSGTYRVATSTHVLRHGSYVTHFANSPSHTILGTLGARVETPQFGSQLVLGVVTNNDDPSALGRVRVRYPALGDDAEGAWARIATTSAGKERGLLMLPVVGEEVLVGFEHGDTRRPYVLGSLFNGKDTPGDDLVHDHDGSFALKSDAEIATESQGDYTIKVGGDLHAETTGKVSMTADQPFEIEGQNISIKGDAQVTIEGTATVELKCGGASITLSPGSISVSAAAISLG
jgi:phage protein D/phage baseplate assembly protein gpV